MPKFQKPSMHAPIQSSSRHPRQQKWSFQEQVHGKGPDSFPVFMLVPVPDNDNGPFLAFSIEAMSSLVEYLLTKEPSPNSTKSAADSILTSAGRF